MRTSTMLCAVGRCEAIERNISIHRLVSPPEARLHEWCHSPKDGHKGRQCQTMRLRNIRPTKGSAWKPGQTQCVFANWHMFSCFGSDVPRLQASVGALSALPWLRCNHT